MRGCARIWLSFLSVTALAVGGDGSDCRGIMRRVRGHVPGAMILNPTLKNFADAVDPGEGKRLCNDAGLTGSGACHRGTWEPAALGVQHRVLALGSELTVPHHGWESVGGEEEEEKAEKNQVAAAASSFGTMAECAVLRGIRGGFDPSERLFDDQGFHQEPLGVQMAPMTGTDHSHGTRSCLKGDGGTQAQRDTHTDIGQGVGRILQDAVHNLLAGASVSHLARA
jgi:hypothetical protein